MNDKELKIDLFEQLLAPIRKEIPLDEYYKRTSIKRSFNQSSPYPSPTEKRIRLEDQIYNQYFQYPPTPPNMYPHFSSNTAAISNRPIAVAKKPSSAKIKEPNVPPTHVISDDGKHVWELIRSIGKGGCGEVFLGNRINSNDKPVAVKIIKERKQFINELGTMKMLNNHVNGRGNTPKLLHACKKQKTLIMEHLSETLSAKFEKCNFHLSLKTILMLAMNIMDLTRDFNLKTAQVHVDIKPSNICTSLDGRELFLIDFGYSTPPTVKLPGQTGTPLFMSYHLQTIGATYPSIQDDLESIGYVLMFFIVGGKKGLPWGALRTHKDISKAKNDDAIRSFCYSLAGTEYEALIPCLINYLTKTRNRSHPFTWKDYYDLYHAFDQILHRFNWTNDKNYDWCDAESSHIISLSSSSKTLNG